MNAKAVRTIIGIIGNIFSLSVSLSHMPKFIQIYKDKSVDADFQQHRHVVMVVKCSLWVLYGLPLVQKDSILVTTSNGVGLVIEVIYLVVFFIYCDKESERKDITGLCLMVEIGLLFFFYGQTLLFLENVSARRKLIGVVCTVYTTIMHGLLALQTKVDGEQFRCMYLPFWFSFVNFINAGIWIAYSVIYKIDVYVLVVNVVGAVACAIHLIILCCSTVRRLLLPKLLPKRVVPSSSFPVV
ncbi:Bidirectional sugar transporter SWEET8 [Raphanus sativus]|uniref:Bidirectional sugar transporter SWEET n=1 Tax=Raphanus sativus TaxID=3726 RepID=A0A6J0NRP3_RAPSA|nr:bidirectional sugar transporter SWEET8-like [Raphanus sativus]KAJ4893084.1 Bidirectional sugar transporter SWEET8 [Raphanus sativus]